MTRQISVNLGSNIVYVSGTVNTKATVWTLVGGSWQAVADRSPDDMYQVELTAIDAAGNTNTFSFLLEYGLSGLITDRTQADVDRALALAAKSWDSMTDEEKAEFRLPLKGAYNEFDLNRVGDAVEFLHNQFEERGYLVDVFPKDFYSTTDFPTPNQMERYLENIQALRSRLPVLEGTPEAPEDMLRLTYSEANDIEKILLNVYTVLNLLSRHWIESGEVFCGEVT